MMTEATQTAAVLFVDIAGSTSLRSRVGDAEAGRRMADLLKILSGVAETHGGGVLKSDGDDLLVLFQQADSAASAAGQAALECQLEAREHGFSLYAGLSFGPVRQIEVLGRPDIEGLCVNLAARLHKLVPNQPGFVFLDHATAALLVPDLKERCRPFGRRELKGIGAVDVMSMDWDDCRTAAATTMDVFSTRRTEPRDLVLSIGGTRKSFPAEHHSVTVGRSHSCNLVIPSPLVSSRHVEFVWEGDSWTARDLSRNGTWVRLTGPGSEVRLQGRVLPLGARGALCLGQDFDRDLDGATTLEFEQMPRSR